MSDAVFFRLTDQDVEDKPDMLAIQLAEFNGGYDVNDVYILPDHAFKKIPKSPFAYWANKKLLSSFEMPNLSQNADAKQGLATAYDFRFLRCWWEVPKRSIGFSKLDTKKDLGWIHFVKGGVFSVYFSNIVLLIGMKKAKEFVISSNQTVN